MSIGGTCSVQTCSTSKMMR